MTARILIVDDDTEVCELLIDFLQLEGFDATAIHDGGEAVRRLPQETADAVVLDIMLPGLQGLEVLRNAVKYTAADTEVRVNLRATDNGYRICIEDRGPGVPEAELDRIFDPLYRVDTDRTRASGGYGLGLAIARRAIEQHGGRLQAQNTGTGLRVTAMLPADSG